MSDPNLIEEARLASGLNNQELADRAKTSRPTLSSYIHGRKIPRLDTAQRIVQAAGHSLSVVKRPVYRSHTARQRPFFVPDRLPRPAVEEALAEATLPIHLAWSGSDRSYDLLDEADRRRLYEIVLREGTPEDIDRYIDGLLLVLIWDELVLPQAIRDAWQPLIDTAKGVRRE